MDDNEVLTSINEEKNRDLEDLKQKFFDLEKKSEESLENLRKEYEARLQNEHVGYL